MIIIVRRDEKDDGWIRIQKNLYLILHQHCAFPLAIQDRDGLFFLDDSEWQKMMIISYLTCFQEHEQVILNDSMPKVTFSIAKLWKNINW